MTLTIQRTLRNMLHAARKVEREIEARESSPEWRQLLLHMRVSANAIESAFQFVVQQRGRR